MITEDKNKNNSNNNRIYIAQYGPNFRDAWASGGTVNHHEMFQPRRSTQPGHPFVGWRNEYGRLWWASVQGQLLEQIMI